MNKDQVAELVIRIGRAESYREIWQLVDELFEQAPLAAKALPKITDAVRASQDACLNGIGTSSNAHTRRSSASARW